MKRIILLIAAVLGFCFGVPQAEAAGGAVAVVYVDAWSHPLYIAADDRGDVQEGVPSGLQHPLFL